MIKLLYLFIGAVRNGKTISIVNEAKKFYDDGYTIYSNTKLNFDYQPLTRKMIIEWEKYDIAIQPKSVFVISEIHAWLDSRNSMSSNNKTFSYFLTQMGHFTDDKQKGLTIIADTQYFTQLDIRARRLTHNLIECIKLNEVENEYIDVLRIWKINNNLILKTFKKEVVRFNKEDFDLYNTQESIKSVDT